MSSRKPSPLRFWGRRLTDVSILVVIRPALGVFEVSNVRSGPIALDMPSQVAQIKLFSVRRSGSLRGVYHRRPVRGGTSPLNALASTEFEPQLRPRPVPTVNELCNDRSPFSAVVLEVDIGGTVEGRIANADVGPVGNSYRTFSGSDANSGREKCKRVGGNY